jgi:C-terminal processing protease CtpA/Prc
MLALAPLAPQPEGGRLTRAQLEEDVRVLEGALRAKWSYYGMRAEKSGFDSAAVAAGILDRRPDGATHEEFLHDLRLVVADMNDGHAHAASPHVSPPLLRFQQFLVRDCPEGIIITAVAADLPDPRPAVGDRLVAIDGEPIDTRIEREHRTAIGSTPGMRRQAAVSAALRSRAESSVIDLETVEGPPRRVSLPTTRALHRSLAPPGEITLGWPRPGVALITVPSFGVSDWAAWLKTPPEERDAFLEKDKALFDAVLDRALEPGPRAVILDLRGNAGGTDLLGIHAAQRFVRKPFRYFQLSGFYGGKWTAPHGTTYQPRKPTLDLPLLVLIDEEVFSTADNFARCLDDLRPDAVFIGRPTGAGTGAPGILATLPHSKAFISACTQRVYGPKGTLIEGVGTTPDVPIRWTRRDVVEGRDPDLEAALERAAEAAPAGGAGSGITP